jgi:hypothetical protein
MRINSFSVRGYKNFTERVELAGLGSVNVIHGDNNVGKSNLLEAMFLFFRLLSRDFCGDRLPLKRPHSVSSGVFEEKTGFQLQDCFNYVKRVPIELCAEIHVSTEDLEDADVGPLSGPSPVTLELVLSPAGLSAELLVRAFTYSDGRDIAGTSATTRNEAFRFALFLARNLLVHDREERPGFVLIEESRQLRGEREPRSSGTSVPQALETRLYKTKESFDSSRVRAWKRFEDAFSRLSGTGGRIGVRYNLEEQRPESYLTLGDHRLPTRLLGSGIQNVVAIVGQTLTTDARFVAIEEPESHLRYTRQLELRDFLNSVVGQPGAPHQVFLTSHSPAFEGPNPFYAIRLQDGHPVIERRTGSREFLGVDASAPPSGAKGSLCYVSSDGLVRVPESIRTDLGLLGGGAVTFVPRKDGHVEMLTGAQVLSLLGDKDV